MSFMIYFVLTICLLNHIGVSNSASEGTFLSSLNSLQSRDSSDKSKVISFGEENILLWNDRSDYINYSSSIKHTNSNIHDTNDRSNDLNDERAGAVINNDDTTQITQTQNKVVSSFEFSNQNNLISSLDFVTHPHITDLSSTSSSDTNNTSSTSGGTDDGDDDEVHDPNIGVLITFVVVFVLITPALFIAILYIIYNKPTLFNAHVTMDITTPDSIRETMAIGHVNGSGGGGGSGGSNAVSGDVRGGVSMGALTSNPINSSDNDSNV